VLEQVRRYTRGLARHLKIKGFINVQYAIKDETVYLLEVNARASRTIPFASKAAGVPLARVATRMIMGYPLDALTARPPSPNGRVSVKTVVLPFDKFPTLMPVLGPEMQSTGEAMGTGPDFATALARARLGAGARELSVRQDRSDTDRGGRQVRPHAGGAGTALSTGAAQ
jgi:carbamoyl-phosphate synthase large subunit